MDKAHIFEPFLEQDLEKKKKDGIGMGLSFSKVFDHHRAKIQIKDNVPKEQL